MKIKIGDSVETLVDKTFEEGIDKKVFIPKGTNGLVCEIYDGWALIEIYNQHDAPNARNVYDYLMNEFKII